MCTHHINYSTIDCGEAMISPNRPSTVSKPTTKNQVDTDVNIDDDSNYFSTPIKYNHSSTEICDTHNASTQGHIKVHPHLRNQSN